MERKSTNRSDGAVAIAAALLVFAWIWQHQLSKRFAAELSYLPAILAAAFLMTVLALLIRLSAQRKRTLRPDKWDKMSGRAFEDQIALWLKQHGFNQVAKTEYFDQGIDLVAAKPGLVVGVQVKRSSRPVGVAAVRAAVAGLKSYGCSQACVVTNAKFTPAAIKLAAVNDCRLIDGNRLRATLR